MSETKVIDYKTMEDLVETNLVIKTTVKNWDIELFDNPRFKNRLFEKFENPKYQAIIKAVFSDEILTINTYTVFKISNRRTGIVWINPALNFKDVYIDDDAKSYVRNEQFLFGWDNNFTCMRNVLDNNDLRKAIDCARASASSITVTDFTFERFLKNVFNADGKKIFSNKNGEPMSFDEALDWIGYQI